MSLPVLRMKKEVNYKQNIKKEFEKSRKKKRIFRLFFQFLKKFKRNSGEIRICVKSLIYKILDVSRFKAHQDPSTVFWTKVERIFGEIPKLIRLILQYNGFDTLLALRGIRWDDKKFFFEALEESVVGISDLDDEDDLKQEFILELSSNHQKLEKFKLKMGHKNLIINLCHELQKTNLEEFNGTVFNTIQLPSPKKAQSEIVVRRKQDDHEHTREEQVKRLKLEEISESPFTVIKTREQTHEIPISDQTEIPYMYETEEEDEEHQFMEQEFLDELETYDENPEIEYQEIQAEDIETDDNCIYATEEIIKNEAGQYEQVESYEISGYESSTSLNRSSAKSKKPKHMYTSEFLQTQMSPGRIGTPGRRRPKIHKRYPDSEEGLLERWSDLVRQSCEVIVPAVLLRQHDLSNIELMKIHDNIWEVKCPLCTKKLRLQLTHEGKYTNYKRSNFERHLRIVHYKQILQFKPDSDEDHIFSVKTC